MKFPIITAILCLLICACGKQNKDPEISLYLGFDDKGRLSVDHEETMHSMECTVRSSGSVENSGEATCKAEYSRGYGHEDKEVVLDLRATSEAGNGSLVKGSYVAKVPFRLTPQGPGGELQEDLAQTYGSGSGEIEIRLESP